MTAYTATFSNGETKTLKNSSRTYTHAWRVEVVRFDGSLCVLDGFSNGEDRARKAARSEISGFVNKPRWASHDSGWRPAQSVSEPEIVVAVAH